MVSGLDRRTLIRGLQTKDALSKGELHEKLKALVAHWREIRGTNNAWAGKSFLKSFWSLLKPFHCSQTLHLRVFERPQCCASVLLYQLFLGGSIWKNRLRRTFYRGTPQHFTRPDGMPNENVNSRFWFCKQQQCFELTFSYGRGGGEEEIYGLCVLPLNIVNQKFYTIFWFWLSVLQVKNLFKRSCSFNSDLTIT